MREVPRKSADEEKRRCTRRCWVFRESEEGEEERLHVTLHGKDTRQGKLKNPALGPYPIPSPSRPLEQAAANLKIGSIPSPAASCRGSTNFRGAQLVKSSFSTVGRACGAHLREGWGSDDGEKEGVSHRWALSLPTFGGRRMLHNAWELCHFEEKPR